MKKLLVRRVDYDFYTMRLPLSVIRRRKRVVFVHRELEKRHPQFSEKCCADTKFTLRQGKLLAEVAVMDTLRLAEYRKAFPNRHLFLEGKPERAVFARHREVRKVIAMALVALTFSIVLGSRHILFQKNGLAKAEQVETTDTVAATMLLPPESLFLSVLSAVGKKGGRVSSLVWQGGNCTFLISGCHPEDIVPQSVCAVSYANNEPRFELKLPVAYTNALLSGGENHFLPHLRKELLQNGVVILREEPGKRDVSLQLFCSQQNLAAALKVCAEEAEVNHWHERALRLQSGENGYDIKVSFSAGSRFYESQSPFQLVAAYASVFEPKHLPEKILPRVVSADALPARKDKVGEIKRLNGDVFVYYRQQDGRIVCEKAR